MTARNGLWLPNEEGKLIMHQFGDFSPHAHSLWQRAYEKSTPRTGPRKKRTTVFIYDRGTRHRWERIFKPEDVSNLFISFFPLMFLIYLQTYLSTKRLIFAWIVYILLVLMQLLVYLEIFSNSFWNLVLKILFSFSIQNCTNK